MDALELVHGGSADDGEPECCGVGEYWFDDGFKGEEYELLVLASVRACEGFQDLAAARCSGYFFVEV